jgi:ribose transport system substrate-binding protein
VVALVDSSKLGKLGLTPFARLEQIDQIVTDDGIAPEMLDQIRRANVGLTICGEESVESFTPSDLDQQHYTIGFANLSEDLLFAVDVRRGVERAVKETNNLDLVLADNQLSGEAALNVADHLIGRGVDLAIEFQIDESAGNLIMDKFTRAGIPVIAVDIPMVGATYFGVDNFRAGHMAGVALGRWIEQHWNGDIDHLLVLVEPRSGVLPAARIQGQVNGLISVIGEITPERISTLDSGNTSAVSEEQVFNRLRELPVNVRIAVLSFNDDAALGALAAARRLGREKDVAIVGQGADRRMREEIRRPGTRIVGSTSFTPERYGEKLIDLALKLLRHEPVPPAVYVEHVFINAANIDIFYPER